MKDWIKTLGIVMIGILCSVTEIDFSITFLTLVLCSLLLAYAFSLNNYFDWKKCNEKNYISTLFLPNRYKLFLCLLPLFLSFPVFYVFFKHNNFIVLIFSFLFIFLYTLYSAPPRLKTNWKFSIFINTFCLGNLLLLIGYFSQTNIPNIFLFIFLSVYSSYLLISELLHQIAHFSKDKKCKIKSFPVTFGLNLTIKTMLILQILVCCLFFLILIFTQVKLILISLFFSILRFFKLKKIRNEKDASYLRDHIYGVEEGLVYFFVLILKFFGKIII